MTEANGRLEELRAAKAEREAAKAAALAAAAEANEIAKLEAEAAFDAAWEAAVAKHGDGCVDRVETLAGLFIVKRPHAALYRRFADSPKSNTEEAIQLVTPCVLFPSVDKFNAVVETQPGIIIDLVLAVSALAGSKKAADLKK